MSPLDWLTSESQGCSCLCFLCAGVATVVSILHCVSFLQFLRYSLPPDHSSLSILCALFLNFLSLHSAAYMRTDVGPSPGIWEASLGRHSWRKLLLPFPASITSSSFLIATRSMLRFCQVFSCARHPSSWEFMCAASLLCLDNPALL